MDAYDLIEFTNFYGDTGIATSHIMANSSQYSSYDQLNTGVFLIDVNQDLTSKRVKLPLIVDKFSYTQFNQVVDTSFTEFAPDNLETPTTSPADFMPINVSYPTTSQATASTATSASVTPSGFINGTWIGPVNLITVNATPDYFEYSINNTLFTGNSIEDIAHADPYNVSFILTESELGTLQTFTTSSDLYKPIVDMILAYNDWYSDPRSLSFKEMPNSTSSGTASTSSATSTTVIGSTSPIPSSTNVTTRV